MQHDDPVIGHPVELLSLEDLNLMVGALLVVSSRWVGHGFGQEVLDTMEVLRTERDIAVAFHGE